MRSIINLFEKYKSSIRNMGYLSLLQCVTMLFPIFTYPYLIRVLGLDLYGKIIYFQGIALFLCSFISYGFNLTATREISNSRSSVNKMSIIYTETIYSKFLVFLVCLIVYFFIAAINDYDYLLFFLCAGAMLSEVFFPIWLYQGLEHLKYSALITIVLRTLLLLSIFLFIRTSQDVLTYALLNLFFHIFLSIISLIICYKKFNITFVSITYHNIVCAFRKGYSVFISTIFVALKDRLNVIFVGFFFGSGDVVIYDFAMKILGLISIPQNIIISAFFAKVISLKEKKFILHLGIFINAVNIIIWAISSVIFFFMIDTIFDYSVGFENKLVILILMFSVLPVGISGVISRLYFIPFSLDSILAKTTILSCLVYFSMIIMYYFFIGESSLLIFSLIISITYFAELFIRIIAFNHVKWRIV